MSAANGESKDLRFRNILRPIAEARIKNKTVILSEPGTPSFRSLIAKGWGTTNLRLPFDQALGS